MCWLTDVIIPIICALIGGGLTMWGVQRTLKAQRKVTVSEFRRQSLICLQSTPCEHLRGTAFRSCY